LENAFAGRGEASKKIKEQVIRLVACREHPFDKLNANRNRSQKIWNGEHSFNGTVHCEAIVAVDLIKHVRDLILIDKC
jgi:hypothetical protein